MNVRNVRVVAGVLLALTVVGCGGRTPPNMEGMLTPLTVEPPPIYAIIGARADLALTSEQVAALDSIAIDIQAVNRPLIADLETVSPQSRSGARRITPEGEPILEQIRSNSRQASEGVHDLLTEAQREKVCELFNRRSQPRSAGRGRGPAPPPRQAPADSTAPGPFGMMGSRWYWCAAPGQADPDATTNPTDQAISAL
jgi:hypothetical protein